MCFRRSRYWEERTEEGRDERLWDLFYRESEQSKPPVPIAEREDERSAEPDEVTAGAGR